MLARTVASLFIVLAAAVVPSGGVVAATTPAYTTFTAPSGEGNFAGEPSIGVNWATGNVMYLAGTEVFRVNNFDSGTGTATWTRADPLTSFLGTADPILYTDTRTNRTFVAQLQFNCSVLSYTDDDGALWVENPFGCGAGYYPDHQSVGGGPFAAPLAGGTPLYNDSVYYCAQGEFEASCALSLNGGLTFLPALPIYIGQCVGLHGHIRVAADGTVYVPNFDCGGEQGVVVSEDNGIHWAIRPVPGSTTPDESDPSVGIGAGGSLYFGYEGGDGHAMIATSHDKGVTWSAPFDAGAAFGIQNSQFPEVIAGDDNRAAYAFLGTPSPGNDQHIAFDGTWHLYIATTYDGGATWTTVDATPTDPVQRGPICLGGTSCGGFRNLLDFNDIAVGPDGRVYVAFADGCVGGCVDAPPNSGTAKAVIARQTSGTGLFAAND